VGVRAIGLRRSMVDGLIRKAARSPRLLNGAQRQRESVGRWFRGGRRPEVPSELVGWLGISESRSRLSNQLKSPQNTEILSFHFH